MNVYNLIIERLKEISKKEVIYGYLEDLIFDNHLLSEEYFTVSLQSLEIETIAINHRKEKTREISIYYVKFNNILDNLLTDVVEIENILDRLTQDEKLKRVFYNIDYRYELQIEKENQNDLTGTIIFNITLETKERT